MRSLLPALQRLTGANPDEVGIDTLVLDGCEHALGAAPEVAALLAACAELTVLATSREPLRLRGEHPRSGR